jgi:hypothetical protein
MSATQADSLRFAPLTASATGTIIAAVAGKSIVVLSACFSLSGTAPTVAFRSGASTLLTGVITGTAAAGGSIVCPFVGSRLNPVFSTNKGESLDVVITGTTLIAGCITYSLEDGQ